MDNYEPGRRFLIDAGRDRSALWPGLRNDAGVAPDRIQRMRRTIGITARALVATDPSPRSVSVAAAASLASGDFDTALELAEDGLRSNGVLGHAAPLATIAALVHRQHGDWLSARYCYSAMLRCRIARYRCSAIAAGALAALDFDDEAHALLFWERGLAEQSDRMKEAFSQVLAVRTRRMGEASTQTHQQKLARLVSTSGLDAGRFLEPLP